MKDAFVALIPLFMLGGIAITIMTIGTEHATLLLMFFLASVQFGRIIERRHWLDWLYE